MNCKQVMRFEGPGTLGQGGAVNRYTTGYTISWKLSCDAGILILHQSGFMSTSLDTDHSNAFAFRRRSITPPTRVTKNRRTSVSRSKKLDRDMRQKVSDSPSQTVPDVSSIFINDSSTFTNGRAFVPKLMQRLAPRTWHRHHAIARIARIALRSTGTPA